MPVTNRNLTVHKVNGAGKKAPANLKYDVVRQQLINVKCDCIDTPIQYIGTFPIHIGAYTGSGVCSGSSCYLSNNTNIFGLQINAIPGTSYTLNNFIGPLFIVNGSTNIIYYRNTRTGSDSQTLFPIPAGTIIQINLLGGANFIFTS